MTGEGGRSPEAWGPALPFSELLSPHSVLHMPHARSPACSHTCIQPSSGQKCQRWDLNPGPSKLTDAPRCAYCLSLGLGFPF